MKEIITVGIAEDHALLRQGLIELLKAHKGIKVLFDVGNGKELMEQLKTTRPNVILLDLEMPVMKGREALQLMTERYSSVKVIVISAYYEKALIIESFKLGARAFLPKDDKIERIVEAINSVHTHGIYGDTDILKILAGEISKSTKKSSSKNNKLSATELEVLRLICKGHARKKVAEMLEVKHETVNFHMSNIFRKTGIESTTVLVSYAIKNKLI